jgi:hypothetical protein
MKSKNTKKIYLVPFIVINYNYYFYIKIISIIIIIKIIMNIKKEELVSYTFFNKMISNDKTVLGIQKINSNDKPLLVDILSEDIILDGEYIIYRNQNYLLETLEIILYDDVPYLCESFSQRSFCKMPQKVVKYLSLLNMCYYGFSVSGKEFFINKITYDNKILSTLPFTKYPSVTIYKKKNIYYTSKKKQEFKLSGGDFFENDNQVILAIYNSKKKNYAIIGYSQMN